jgi:hypothetical protein
VSLAEGGGRIAGRRSAHLQATSMDAGMEPGTQTVGVDVTAEWHLQ